MDIQPLGTVVFTTAAGIFALILGSKTRFPTIIFLLFFGILLGPHFLNIVQPKIFRSEFPHYISVLVALILFEGGASLKFSQFHEISQTLRRLLTGSVVVTLVLVALAVYAITGWHWQQAVLFGSILIVTGPTVIIPILNRIRLQQNLHNILKWEAILIDPLGVVIAVVLFELLVYHDVSWWGSLGLFAARIIMGSALGIICGWIMYVGLTRRRLLRFEGEELGGLYVLACNLLFYGIAEWILKDSGLVVTTVAGIYLGNRKFALQDQIFHFKKQITLLALSGLFILLSANVPVESLSSVWGKGTALLAFLIFVVRPASIFVGTIGDKKLTIREKLFLSFLAPRGIVSASLASLFAIGLEARGFPGSEYFLPLAFFVIAGSIIFYASFAGLITKMLGVQEKEGRTVLIVGANKLGLLLGQELHKREIPVKFLDSNPYFSLHAKGLDFEAYTGSAFDRNFLETFDMKGLARLAAVTPNHEVNMLACQAFSRYLSKQSLFRLWGKPDTWESVTASNHDDTQGRPLFVFPQNFEPDLGQFIQDEDLVPISVPHGEPLKITEKSMKSWEKMIPLFAVNQKKLIFLHPNAEIPKESELVFAAPKSMIEAKKTGDFTASIDLPAPAKPKAPPPAKDAD